MVLGLGIVAVCFRKIISMKLKKTARLKKFLTGEIYVLNGIAPVDIKHTIK